jgi:two-component system, response regulator PdtaR
VTATVVIADDESIIRLDLKEMLEGAGYDVVGEAARGDEAAELIEAKRPDLALLDIKMPGLSGIEVAERVRVLGTTVVLLTAFSQRDLIEGAQDTGVVAYLVKPFRRAELLAKLASILQGEDASGEAATVDDKIETRALVQRAKERLMADRHIDEPSAFELIQQTAMRSRSRMRDVAQRVLDGDPLE